MNMPKRPDEVALWEAFGKNGEPHEYVGDAAEALGIPWRRAYYLCCKWSEKGVFEWGTSWYYGWKLTEEQQELERQVRAQEAERQARSTR